MTGSTRRTSDFARYLEWVKVLLGGSIAVAALISYGFLSETAAYQFVGLPQLQADVFEMAEQGGRNFIDSVATLGLFRGFGLLLMVVAITVLWWRRSRHPMWAAFVWSVRVLQILQLVLLLVVFMLLASLVELRAIALPSAHNNLAEREREVRSLLRERCDRFDPECETITWDARDEFARIEALDFEVGPVRLLCRSFPDWDTLCFTALDYERTNDSSRWRADESADLGIGKRRTTAARMAARNTFGSLFAVTLTSLLLAYLLIEWRYWIERTRRGGKRLTPATDAHSDNGNQSANPVRALLRWLRDAPSHSSQRPHDRAHRGFYSASRRFFEPLLLLLLLICIGMLPSAYGVLAKGTVGTQPVLVRLKDPTEAGESCAGLAAPVIKVARTRGTIVKSPDEEPSVESHDRIATAGSQAGDGTNLSHWHARVCQHSELDQIEEHLLAYQRAWRDLYQVRPQETGADTGYQLMLETLKHRTDDMVRKLAGLGCPEAYGMVWSALPREPHFTTRLEAAQYVWERWTELQRTRSLARFGYLVNYPRGSHQHQLLVADLLARRSTTAPIRVAMVPVPMACTSGIELIPDLAREKVLEAKTRLFANPADVRPIQVLERFPGEFAIAAMLEVLESEVLPVQAAGMLITQLGTQAGMIRLSNPLLHQAVVDALAQRVETGASATRTERESVSSNDVSIAGSGDMNEGLAPRSAALGRSAATGLHLAGGAGAAMAVTQSICRALGPSRNSASNASPICTRQSELLESAGAINPDRLNKLGTLVTAAGFLANDVAQELIGTPPTSCPGGASGPASQRCHNQLVWVQNALDAMLLSTAGASKIAATDAVHSVTNRRAACTALGLSGSQGAVNALADLIPKLIEGRNEFLLGACLVHAPNQLSVNVRKLLRQLVLGLWPNRAVIDSSGLSNKKPPTGLIRIAALTELSEAGLYFEHELVRSALNSELAEVRQLAAQVADEVEPQAMGDELWNCAYPSENQKASEKETRLRCLLALALLEETEDGDGGLAERVFNRLSDTKTPTEDVSPLCYALAEFRARGGREASRYWDEATLASTASHEQSRCGIVEKEADRRKKAILDSIASTKGPTSIPGATATFANRSASQGTKDDAESMSQADTDLFARFQAARAGDPEALEAFRSAARGRGGNLSRRLEALVGLSQLSFQQAGSVAIELFMERPATLLTLFSGQFIEDATASEVDPALVDCAIDASREAALRARCLHGLALTAGDYLPNEESRAGVIGLINNEVFRNAACRAAGEFARRAGENPPTACDDLLKLLPANDRERWENQLESLQAQLRADRKRHGPFPGESGEQHEQQLEALSAGPE